MTNVLGPAFHHPVATLLTRAKGIITTEWTGTSEIKYFTHAYNQSGKTTNSTTLSNSTTVVEYDNSKVVEFDNFEGFSIIGII